MKINAIYTNHFNQPQNHKNRNTVSTPIYSAIPKTSLSKFSDTNKYMISFRRNQSEHASWGATFNQDNSVNFKLFSCPDAKDVYVEILPENSENTDDIFSRGLQVQKDEYGIPNAVYPTDETSKIFKLNNDGNGIFQTKNIQNISNKSFYRFIIVKKYGEIQIVKDPYSKRQPDILGWSRLYDNRKFNWTDKNWMEGNDKRKISRQKNSGLKNINALRIYELNIPTISQSGDFEGAKAQLDRIKSQNLANAVEIMPVENTFSKQWGYDGVDKFAVNEKLGGPDGLKDLINHAHSIGLNVIMDMVPNHIGPDGEMLAVTGPYIRGCGSFGNEFNYEGKDSRYVRDFISNAALNWAKEYHVDGLRLDMTNPSVMGSDLTLKQIVAEVNEHCKDVFMIAEDASNNRKEITTPIQTTGDHAKDISDIDEQVSLITTNNLKENTNVSDIGFDSEWDFPLMHNIHNMTETPYDTDIFDFDRTVRNSNHRIAYATSHDETGNYDGTSATVKYATSYLNLSESIPAENQTQKNQKAAHATQKLLTLFATGKMDKMSDDEFSQTVKDLGISRTLTKADIKNAYQYALNKMKLALGTVYTIPGPKMYFQGNENAGLDYFKFFREFSDSKRNDEATKTRIYAQKQKMDIEKGYDTDYKSAYPDSMTGNIECSPKVDEIMNKLSLFTTDLNNICENHTALQDGNIENTQIFEDEKVHCIHSVSGKDEVFAVKNYSPKAYPVFNINFPAGEWKEIINSDNTKYAGNGNYLNNRIYSDGHAQSPIRLPDNSVIIFERVK